MGKIMLEQDIKKHGFHDEIVDAAKSWSAITKDYQGKNQFLLEFCKGSVPLFGVNHILIHILSLMTSWPQLPWYC